MNPLDFSGPEFLFFYLILGIVTLALLWVTRKIVEVDTDSRIDVSDPYLIAYLRGGKLEAARVAIMSLCDRGLLQAVGDFVMSDKEESRKLARRPIELFLMNRLSSPRSMTDIMADRDLEEVCRPMHEQLVMAGALPDERLRDLRRAVLLVGLIVLLGTAGAKIVVALSRGRHNIWFLVVAAALLTLFSYLITHPRRTTGGDAVLADLKQLFSGLRDRASSISPGGASGELALLASVFGIGAVPLAIFPSRKQLFPGADRGGASSSCGGGGCGSGGSCGGGGGCGGGGCGGCGG